MKTINITKQMLEAIASHSLEGILYDQGVREPCELTLSFQQSSLSWRELNDGPEALIMPEYVPMCLCESIVNLIKQGFKVSIWHFEQDEVTE